MPETTDSTSNSACLALLGILPIESVLHKTLLNLFVNMIRDPNSTEYEIAQRQLVMRDLPPNSTFSHLQCILDQYGLPSIFELLRNTPSKPVRKRTLNHKIYTQKKVKHHFLP